MNAKISVIIPVYNSEKFLEECIESVLKQSYKHLEIILVNDGSTDSSGYICETYKNKDERIIVLHKENSGVSDARNLGLSIITGDYVTFVDSDDIIDSNHISDMYNKILVHSDVDVVFSGFGFLDDGRIEKKIEKNPCIIDVNQNAKQYLDFLSCFFKFKNNIFGSVCRVLWKKNVIDEVRFTKEIRISEDLLFIVKALEKVNKICCIDNIGYLYRINHNSVTKKYKQNYIKSQNYLYKELKTISYKINDTNFNKTLNTYYSILVYYTLSNEIKYRPIEWKENIRILKTTELYNYFKLISFFKIDSVSLKFKYLLIFLLVKLKVV